MGFESRVLAATGGGGVNVILNSLAREFVDASLRLLPQGGRFVELGKTDIRETAAVSVAHRGVVYRAFDLPEAGLDRIQQMLVELGALFGRGVLRPLPTRSWDVRRAPEAFRFVAQARHVGKVVLTIPRPLAPAGTVLITGGPGTLGSLVARHLVARHGVRHLLLCSRTGSADALRQELAAAGACVRVAACDVSDREGLRGLLSGIDAEHPLTAVIHTAGVIDDGVFDAMRPERIDKVFAPKLDAAWHLHRADQGPRAGRLRAVFFGLWGGGCCRASQLRGGEHVPGCAGASPAARRGCRPARWRGATGAPRSGLTGHLSAADTARMSRGGMVALSSEDGLALLDRALGGAVPLLVPARLDLPRLSAAAESLPPLLQGSGARKNPVHCARRRLGSSSVLPRGCPLPSASGGCSTWYAARPRRC